MKKIKLLICKISGFILKTFGRGSNFPGELLLKLDKNYDKYFKMPKIVIAVTGSAGKGSTTTIIADTLRKSGLTVSHNKFGSNMLPGILSLLISSSDLSGNIKTDALVLEVDERYTKKVFALTKPEYVVITNICRDQPPRHGHVDLVFEKIKEALNDNMHLILNADDPYLQKFNLDNKYKVTYYGISNNKYTYKNNKFNNINMYYCPKCMKKLKYNYYHFEAIGDYYCDCGFKRPNIDYYATNINLDKSIMTINNKYDINISFNVLYYAYNILASYSVCKLVGLDESDISKYISSMENNKKLNDSYKYKNRCVYVMNNKNENSTTFNESVLFTENHKTERTIVIGWKEISRRYEFNDMSWLYDIEFELLNTKYTDKVICVGRDKYSIATRMKYAGFSDDKIRVYDTLEDAEKMIKNKSKGDIFAILNFDYVKPFNEMMGRD